MKAARIVGDRMVFEQRFWIAGVIMLVVLGIPGLGLLWLTTAGWWTVDYPKPGLRPALATLGLVFFLGPALLTMFRSTVVVDRRNRLVMKGRGFLKRMSARLLSFDEETIVSLSRVERRIDGNTYIVFPVLVHAVEGAVKLAESQDYAKSRRIAESVARFAELPLGDVTAGATVRAHDALDENLADRHGAPDLGALPEAPQGQRIRVRRASDGVVVCINEERSPVTAACREFGIAAASGIVTWLLGSWAIAIEGFMGPVLMLFALLLGFYAIASLVAPLSAGFLGTKVLLREDRVVSQGASVLGVKKRAIALDVVEEIVMDEHRTGVLLRSDDETFSLVGFSTEQATWLFESLRAVYQPRPNFASA